MCSLEQSLSLSCIVILNVNQSEVTFLWREWSHQPYADIYSNFIQIIVQITVNNLVVRLFEIMYGTYSDSATPYNFLNKALY